jgi:putative ABC transport system ATP-binding protein
MQKKVVASLNKVTKYYRLGDVKITALYEVNFILHEGDFVLLAGPSGSGKSTLLHLMGCIDKHDRGRIVVDGIDTTDMTLEDLTEVRLEKIGFVFQSFNLIPVLTAYENIELPLLFTKMTPAEIRSRVEEVLQKVGLLKRKDHYPSQLSGGQQQRVAIARALVGRPRLILADEPTANLDSKTGTKILDLLLQLNQEEGVTVLIVTHDPVILEKTTTIIDINDGRI